MAFFSGLLSNLGGGLLSSAGAGAGAGAGTGAGSSMLQSGLGSAMSNPVGGTTNPAYQGTTMNTMAQVSNTMGSLGQIVGGILNAIQSQRQTPQSKLAEHSWERLREPVGQVYNQTYYNPVLAQYAADVAQAFQRGQTPSPYSVTPYGSWTEKEAYSWNPSQATQQLYGSYLNRQYGLPESIARAQAAQAMQPMRMPRLGQSAITPMQVSQQFGQSQGLNPGSMANALLGSKIPEVTRQNDYLTNAAQLAQYNLRKAQQLPMLIG